MTDKRSERNIGMKIERITDTEIKFNNGITLEYYHAQDCCENVYADFEYLHQYNVLPSTGENISIYDIEFDEDIYNIIEYEEDLGIKLVSKTGDKWFIPCYNEQNGYYNDRLELIIKFIDKPTIRIDISDYVKDDIY